METFTHNFQCALIVKEDGTMMDFFTEGTVQRIQPFYVFNAGQAKNNSQGNHNWKKQYSGGDRKNMSFSEMLHESMSRPAF